MVGISLGGIDHITPPWRSLRVCNRANAVDQIPTRRTPHLCVAVSAFLQAKVKNIVNDYSRIVGICLSIPALAFLRAFAHDLYRYRPRQCSRCDRSSAGVTAATESE